MSQDKLIKLACNSCKAASANKKKKQINYWSSKRKKGDDIKRIVLNKHCPICKKHTIHEESKK